MAALGLSEVQLLSAGVVFLRVGAAVAVLPVVGERVVPMRVRLVLALAMTAAILPIVGSGLDLSGATPAQMVIYLGTEVIHGLAVGMMLRLFVIALQVAGSIAAQSTSLSQLFGGAAVEPQPAIGHVLVTGGLALFVTFGLHVRAVEFLVLSYDVLPAGTLAPASDLAQWGVTRIGHAFALGFSLATPFVVASLIYNIALGAINRAMPQLMVSFVGAPAITAGGLILLALSAPIMISVWLGAVSGFLVNPFGGSP